MTYGQEKWEVRMAPHEERPPDVERNGSGIRVFLSNGVEESEVSCVSFVRRNSKNPRSSFKKALRFELAVAAEACEALNDAERAVREARAEVDKAVAEAEARKRGLIATPAVTAA